MNKKYYSFWFRFSLFLVVFAIAFFLVMFVVDEDPVQNFRVLLIKIGFFATISSLFYNLLIESNPKTME